MHETRATAEMCLLHAPNEKRHHCVSASAVELAQALWHSRPGQRIVQLGLCSVFLEQCDSNFPGMSFTETWVPNHPPLQ